MAGTALRRRPDYNHQVIASCSVLAGLLVLSAAAPHPQDGPDADVRIVIDGRAVRFNMVMNLAFVDGLVGLLREDEEALHPVEYGAVQDALVDYFKEHNRVRIDGVAVTPVVRGFEVAEPDLSLLPLFPRMGVRALIKLRLVLEYTAKTRPGKVAMKWGAYPPDIVLATPDGVPPVTVQAQLLADGTDRVIRFRQEEPEYVWHRDAAAAAARFLPVPQAAAAATVSVPLLSVALLVGLLACVIVPRLRRALPILGPVVVVAAVLSWDTARIEIATPAGSQLPSEQEALAIFQPLHANIYRAFDYTSESEIYDALARSVEGSLLDALYNQIYRSLIMQEEGGAVSRVKEVTPIRTEVREIGLLPPGGRPGFRVRARWRVLGVVHHWGHSHARTNEYEAEYAVALAEPGWRIAGHRVLESIRVEAAPELPPENGK